MLNEADAYSALRDMKGDHKSHELGLVLIERAGFVGSLDSAAAHVRKSLNPNDPECLKNIETLILEQYTGRHAWLEFHCAAMGYETPKVMRVDQALYDTLERADRLADELARVRAEADRLRKLMVADGEPAAVFVFRGEARFSQRS